jgi:hypothetical protein
MNPHTANRADHVGGHVAMASAPYFPSWPIPAEVRQRRHPWACTFHTDDGGPYHFVAFGPGMLDAVYALLGPRLLKMYGGLFETLADRVDFVLDGTPLQGGRLVAVAEALAAFIASPTFLVDCYLVGVDPQQARRHLVTMQMAVESHRSITL